ncbi:MAG: sigma-54-dependent transcriptional regulator [bacterium]
MTGAKILIVDDDPGILYSLSMTLKKEGYKVVTAADGKECIERVDIEKPQVIFMDIAMPEISGLEALEALKEKGVDIPVIVMTGYGTMQNAIRAVQLGAYEYITKPLDREKIKLTTARALETLRLKREVTDLQSRLDSDSSDEEILGTSPAMQEIYKAIGAVTGSSNLTTVLIEGESGTGKELVAKAIHNHGVNAREPFVAINCTVLPKDLLASELFGHEKGAFTGAVDRRIGKLEYARSGTIFLDEIGDMDLDLQKKFLRVLQERQFQRLGSNTTREVQARFITATNKDLKQAVSDGSFREDLYYRLNVVNIKLPPLRERLQDIPLLANHFLRQHNRMHGKKITAISSEVMTLFESYSWPGNVRELENVMHSSVTLEQGDIILPSSLPASMREAEVPAAYKFPISTLNLEEARKQFTEVFERQYIEHLYRAAKGNVPKAAELAGVTVRSIQRLIQKYGIGEH